MRAENNHFKLGINLLDIFRHVKTTLIFQRNIDEYKLSGQTRNKRFELGKIAVFPNNFKTLVFQNLAETDSEKCMIIKDYKPSHSSELLFKSKGFISQNEA